MNVVVTGGSGRIGAVLLSELQKRGHSAVNIDRRPPAHGSGSKFVFGDVRDRQFLQPILASADVVLHLGEIPHADQPFPVEHIYSANTAAASTVFQAAADIGMKRVVYVSTCQVYGTWGGPLVPPLRLPMDETHPVQPQNAYAAGKAANETYADVVARYKNLPVSILRFPWVMSRDWEERMFDNLAHDTGQMEGMKTYLEVHDAAAACIAAAESTRPGCERYHFVADEIFSLTPLAERLASHHLSYPPLPADWPPFKSPVLTTKALDHLGWRPTYNILHEYAQKRGPIPERAA